MDRIPSWIELCPSFDHASGSWTTEAKAMDGLAWVKSKIGAEIADFLELFIESSGGGKEWRIYSRIIGAQTMDSDGYFWPYEARLSVWLLECGRLAKEAEK